MDQCKEKVEVRATAPKLGAVMWDKLRSLELDKAGGWSDGRRSFQLYTFGDGGRPMWLLSADPDGCITPLERPVGPYEISAKDWARIRTGTLNKQHNMISSGGKLYKVLAVTVDGKPSSQVLRLVGWKVRPDTSGCDCECKDPPAKG